MFVVPIQYFSHSSITLSKFSLSSSDWNGRPVWISMASAPMHVINVATRYFCGREDKLVITWYAFYFCLQFLQFFARLPVKFKGWGRGTFDVKICCEAWPVAMFISFSGMSRTWLLLSWMKLCSYLLQISQNSSKILVPKAGSSYSDTMYCLGYCRANKHANWTTFNWFILPCFFLEQQTQQL